MIENKFIKKSSDGKKFQWRNRTQHILFFLSYLLDWRLFSFLFYENPEINPKHVPSLVHYLVVVIIIGRPVLFFQTFVGEYTRRGCIFIGEMLPLTYGLGYSMLLISFVKFAFELFYAHKVFCYLFAAFFNTRQLWMVCSKRFYSMFPNCFQKEDIDLCPSRAKSNTTCFEPFTKLFSAFIYKEYSVFSRYLPLNRVVYEQKSTYNGFHFLFLLPLLLIFSLKDVKSFTVSLRATMILSLGGLLSILVVVISRPGCQTGFYSMLKQINTKSLLDWCDLSYCEVLKKDKFFEPSAHQFLKTWTTAIRRIILGLRLAEGGHFLFGSFIPELIPDQQRSLYLTIVFVLLTFSITLYHHLLSGLLIFKLNMEINQLDLEKAEHTIFITYPLVLGIQASSYFFSVIYFLVIFLISFHGLVLRVFVLQKTITVQFNLKNYSRYIKVALIVLATISSITLEMSPYYTVIAVIENEFKYFEICALALQIQVLFLYGIQRISDDIYFYMRSEVSGFTKLCWIVSLVLCVITTYLEFRDSHSKVNFAIRMSVCGIFCLPFVVFFLIQLLTYVNKKNIIGLLRPSDLYGPPDIEKRVLRILYNPRLSINSKGREEVCYHECLLKSNALKIAVQEEIDLIKKFITDLQDQPSDVTLNVDIISQLKLYEKNLLKELNKK